MKRIVLALLVSLGLMGAVVHAQNPYYCGSDPWSVSYRKVYQYPTGTYWVNQITRYPDYYAQNNAYYLNAYGC